MQLRNSFLSLLALGLFLWTCTPKVVTETTETETETPKEETHPATEEKEDENLSPCPKFSDAPNPDQTLEDYVLYRDFMKAKDRLRGLHWIEKQLMRYRDKQGGLMAVIHKETGEFMGMSGLIIQHIDNQTELEVGYHLFPKYWGNGYASEAAIHFKELGFQISDVSSIVSYIEKNNIASQKVAERNGMSVSDKTRWKELDVLIYRIERP